jgi:hypothetical protein
VVGGTSPTFERRLAEMGIRVRRFRRLGPHDDPFRPLIYAVQAGRMRDDWTPSASSS